MSVIDVPLTMIHEFARSVPTEAAPDDSLVTSSEANRKNIDAWKVCIDDKLIEWGRSPNDLAEDELIPPTRASIACAIEIATAMCDVGAPAPLRVVPDGDGGVVLERWRGEEFESIEVSQDGQAKLVRSNAGKVLQRSPWPSER